MKKTIILTIALAALLVVWILYRETQSFFKSSTKTEQASWIKYRSPSGLFAVSIPSTPEFKSEIERDPDGFATRTNETYTSEDDRKNLYIIYFIRYLAGDGQLPLPANTLLNNLMYEILESQKGSQLLGFRKVNFKGRTGLEFSIATQDLMMDNLAFVDKGDLYLLSKIGHDHSIHQKDFDRFTQSFEFK